MAITTIPEGTWIGIRVAPTYAEAPTIDDSGGDQVAYGTFTYNKVQLGRESSYGTAVAASTIWRGPAIDLTDDRTRVRAGEQENVGLLVPSDRSYVAAYMGRLSLPETELTFEQVVHLLEMGVKTATPSGAGPYTYTYNWPLTAAVNTIKTYTIETGNALAGDVNEMEYCFAEEIRFSGQYGEAWKMAATIVGRQVTASTFTGSLSVPAVEEALFGKTALYIDDSGGSVGTTQKSGVLTAAEFTIKTGLVPVPVGDGNLYFASHKFVPPQIEFSLTLELENTSSVVATERAKRAAEAVRLVRLDVPGTSSRNFRIDLAAKWESIDSYQNSDGDTLVKFNGYAVHSSADSLFCDIVVTNNLASVP